MQLIEPEVTSFYPFSCHVLSFTASCSDLTRTLILKMMRGMFYHCGHQSHILKMNIKWKILIIVKLLLKLSLYQHALMHRQIVEPEKHPFPLFPVKFYLSLPVTVAGHEPSTLRC